MITAAHTRWAKGVFIPVIEGLLHFRFDRFYCTNSPPEIDDKAGLLITPNHFSWWDGFFIHHLYRKSEWNKKRKLHLMMLEEQLSKHWYFRHLGAFSIDPGHRESVIQSIRYTAGILDDPGKLAVMYPQGETQSYTERPLHFRRGMERILKLTHGDVVVMPVFFRVEYHNRKKPEIWCGFGTPHSRESVIGDPEGYIASVNSDIAGFDRRVEARQMTANLFGGTLPPAGAVPDAAPED